MTRPRLLVPALVPALAPALVPALLSALVPALEPALNPALGRVLALPHAATMSTDTCKHSHPQAASRVAFSYTQAEFTFPISEQPPPVSSLR